MHIADVVFDEVGIGLAVAQDAEHRLLGRRHVGLIERAHVHEVAAHRDGVFPHDEMLGKLGGVIDFEVETRNRGVKIRKAHLEVLAFVPQVGFGLVHDGGAIARILVEQQGIELDVGKNALASLAEAFGNQLLDP